MKNFDELKGFDKVDEIISEFVAWFDCEAELSDEFVYFHDDCTVGYTLVIGDFADKVWKEYVLKKFNYSIKNTFVFSLLHEIGHHYTIGLFDSKRTKEEKAKIDRIEKLLKLTSGDDAERVLHLAYFDLPTERIATEWAVKYARENEKELNDFWNKLNSALREFYRLNLDPTEWRNLA